MRIVSAVVDLAHEIIRRHGDVHTALIGAPSGLIERSQRPAKANIG
jgi:hypothetical protein